MPPTVSVILPTRNRAETLPRAIQSVLDQTFEDLELIVIDDGSTDGSDRVLDSYRGDHRVRVLKNPRRGAAAARNTGIEAAQGRLIAFQDSDDQWQPEMLQRLVEALDKTGPEVGMAYGDMTRAFADGRTRYHHSPEIRQSDLIIDERTFDYRVIGIGIQSTLIKRECLDQCGGFDEALPRFIDLDLFIRLADRFEFLHVSEPLVTWYQTEGITSNKHWEAIARQRLIQKYRPMLRKKRNHLARQYLKTANAMLQCGQYRYAEVFPYALKALLTAPLDEPSRSQSLELLRWGWPGVVQRARRVIGLSPRGVKEPVQSG